MEGKEPTIPIAVDSIKTVGNVSIVRCSYFSIENSEPDPGLTMAGHEFDIPFLMTGVSGVITGPPGSGGLFDSPHTLDRLFEAVDTDSALYVDQNHLWLPHNLFTKDPLRGDIYRIGYVLFNLAYLLREESLTLDEFLARTQDAQEEFSVGFSDPETQALREWNDIQIQLIREDYHANPKAQLPKKKGRGPQPGKTI